jgi:DNA ligase-1
MYEVINQIDELRKLTGNAQLDYLRSVKSDLLKEILDYTYNPDKMYKVDECKLALVTIKKGLIARKLKNDFTVQDWNEFTAILDELSEKREADLNDVRKLKYFITGYSSLDAQQLMSMVVAKDLRLNLGIKKLQTIWPDFCNKPEVQLAENYKGEIFTNGLYSRKFDGKRMYIMDGVAYSRSNKPCKIAPIQHILQQLPLYMRTTVLDGEILYFDDKGNEDFQKGISLTSSDERTLDCNNLYYVIFDAMESAKFKDKEWELPFSEEYKMICELLEAKDSDKFGYSVLDTLAPNILIARQDSQRDKLQSLCNLNKWEGLMYRNADAPYEFKRTRNLLKIKSMQDGEFMLAGLSEGTGKNKNKLGALNIKYQGNIVGVGSGFTDEDRELIWSNSKLFLSTVFTENFDVKVQYFEQTTDAKGNPSLRFPVFLCFRHKETKEEMWVSKVIELYGDEIYGDR